MSIFLLTTFLLQLFKQLYTVTSIHPQPARCHPSLVCKAGVQVSFGLADTKAGVTKVPITLLVYKLPLGCLTTYRFAALVIRHASDHVHAGLEGKQHDLRQHHTSTERG